MVLVKVKCNPFSTKNQFHKKLHTHKYTKLHKNKFQVDCVDLNPNGKTGGFLQGVIRSTLLDFRLELQIRREKPCKSQRKMGKTSEQALNNKRGYQINTSVTSWVVRKVQSKTTAGYTSHSVGWLKFKTDNT